MLNLIVLTHLALTTRPAQALASRRRSNSTHAERGSVTMEYVLWAVAVIAIVGVVVVAITNYVNGQSAKIK